MHTFLQFFSKLQRKYEEKKFHLITFHNVVVFVHVFRKSDCMVDNIQIEKYVESMLNIYFHFSKAKFSFNDNGLVLPVVHAWDIPHVVLSQIIVMSKYSNAKFEFPCDKFFTFSLKSF